MSRIWSLGTINVCPRVAGSNGKNATTCWLRSTSRAGSSLAMMPQKSQFGSLVMSGALVGVGDPVFDVGADAGVDSLAVTAGRVVQGHVVGDRLPVVQRDAREGVSA